MGLLVFIEPRFVLTQKPLWNCIKHVTNTALQAHFFKKSPFGNLQL